MSDEHGDPFHQNLKPYEARYQGFWDIILLADHFWSIFRETDRSEQKIKSDLVSLIFLGFNYVKIVNYECNI